MKEHVLHALFVFSIGFLYLESKAGSYKHIKQIMCLYEPVFMGLGDRGVSFSHEIGSKLNFKKGED